MLVGVGGISRRLDLWVARNRLKGLVYEIATDASSAAVAAAGERNANCHSLNECGPE